MFFLVPSRWRVLNSASIHCLQTKEAQSFKKLAATRTDRLHRFKLKQPNRWSNCEPLGKALICNQLRTFSWAEWINMSRFTPAQSFVGQTLPWETVLMKMVCYLSFFHDVLGIKETDSMHRCSSIWKCRLTIDDRWPRIPSRALRRCPVDDQWAIWRAESRIVHW